MSVAEIAQKLGIQRDTVYVWLAKKNMPGHRLGRVWRFDPVEVDAWVRSGAAAPMPTAAKKAKKSSRPGRKKAT
jgi:excisionase family DNA binding protein